MALVGTNHVARSTFPVDVSTSDPRITVEHLTLVKGERWPGMDIVVGLGYNIGESEPPTFIALLVVISATITDPVTHIEAGPRVYDEWAPVPWSARPTSVRIAAPLSAHYWVAPDTLTVDLRVTSWRGSPPTG